MLLKTEYRSHMTNKEPSPFIYTLDWINLLRTGLERFTITPTRNLITANETLFGRHGKNAVYSKLRKFSLMYRPDSLSTFYHYGNPLFQIKYT